MALALDGVDDRVMTESITGVPVTFPFTIAAVVRLTVAAAPQQIIGLGSVNANTPWRLQSTAGGLLTCVIGSSGGVNSSFSLTNDEVCLVASKHLDSTTHALYIYRYALRSEGTTTSTASRTPGATTSPRLKVGCRATAEDDSAFTNFLGGTVYWAAVWAAHLSTGADGFDGLRAVAHFGPRVFGNPAYLVEFNEMTGTAVYDRSGNGNTATMYNFPASPWAAVDLPGPWWTRRPRYVTKTAPAAATKPYYFRRYVLDRHRGAA